MSVVDEISPSYYGEDRIGLSLIEAQARSVLVAFQPVIIDVDYSACDPQGVVLPLELTITSESGSIVYQRKVFRRLAPSQVTFVPREGGEHLVRLAEQHHNRWFGRLHLAIQGSLVRQSIQ